MMTPDEEMEHSLLCIRRLEQHQALVRKEQVRWQEEADDNIKWIAKHNANILRIIKNK
jgi:hypothetical protein